jgi:hypothetical protein
LRNKLSSDDIKSLEDAMAETTAWLDKTPKPTRMRSIPSVKNLRTPLAKAAGRAGDMPAGGFKPDMNGASPMNGPADGPIIEGID